VIRLKHFEPNYNGNNILHHYALNIKALEMIYNEIQKLDDGEDDNLEDNKYK
jgi:hypothetical protein